MKNKEKFASEIVEIALEGCNIAFSKKENKLIACRSIYCDDCMFFDKKNCNYKIVEWCESEYEEPRITIPPDTPVDTKILVSRDGLHWCNRYFAKMDNDYVYAFAYGATSWSNNNGNLTSWEYGKLAEESDGT